MVAIPQIVPGTRNFDLPLIGDDLAKVGRVMDLWAQPCSPTAIIWVKAFWQAVPTLFITLTKPELIDISIKKGSHRPRKGRRLKFRADALFRDALIEVPVPRWVPFVIYEWTQRIGWYFLVADASEDFAINWMSLAYRWEGCQGDIPPYGARSCENQLQATANGAWPILLFVDAVHDIDPVQPHFTIIEPGFYRFSWQMTFYPHPNPSLNELPYGTALFVDNGSGFEMPTPGESGEREDGGVMSSGFAAYTCNGGERFQLRSLATKDGNCYSTGQLQVYAEQYDGIAPDP